MTSKLPTAFSSQKKKIYEPKLALHRYPKKKQEKTIRGNDLEAGTVRASRNPELECTRRQRQKKKNVFVMDARLHARRWAEFQERVRADSMANGWQ